MIVDFPRDKANGAKESANVKDVKPLSTETSVGLPVFSSAISAGAPTPVEDYTEGKMDLNTYLIKHPESTFIVRVTGNSMIDAGIHPDDFLIVDRKLAARDGKIVIAMINGELTVKRLCILGQKLYLMPENPDYSGIEVTGELEFQIWGVVTNVIHPL